MAEIGDIIQSGESIPNDVARLTDRDEDPWSRVGDSVPSGVWQCEKGRPGDVRSGDIVSLEWGPLTVTAVREPERKVERAGWPEEAAYWTDDADGDSAIAVREPESQQADVSVLDLVRQYTESLVRTDGLPTSTAVALWDLIAALVPQQPVQARDSDGKQLWIHPCGSVLPFGAPPNGDAHHVYPPCPKPGPWRPLLVGGEPRPEPVQAHDEHGEPLWITQGGAVIHHGVRPAPDWRPLLVADAAPDGDRTPEAVDLGEALDEAVGDYEAARAKLLEVVVERDEASAEVERLKAMLVEIAPAPADPLVLSLPEVPEGAVALVGGKTGNVYRRTEWSADLWIIAGEGTAWNLAAILRDEGSVRVEMAPREPRTWPVLAAAPDDLPTLRGRSGAAYGRSHFAEGVPVYRVLDDLTGEPEGRAYSFYALQGLDGPLTEVFDEPGGAS